MSNLEGDPFQAQLFGTKAGAIVKPSGGDDSIRIYTEQNKQLFDLKPANVPNVDSSHTAEIQAFVDAILNDKPSPVPGENGLILNAIFDALYKSSDTGKEEPVNVTF
jgi:predicted dehydrogenase